MPGTECSQSECEHNRLLVCFVRSIDLRITFDLIVLTNYQIRYYRDLLTLLQRIASEHWRIVTKHTGRMVFGILNAMHGGQNNRRQDRNKKADRTKQ
ncbi:MAG: hypothetical protein BWY82_01281 [Verrucomicrobia bacterium ADurb.Bin474]|nr:MAG: hypothetical protein BWY82_01281 [Verrucomicrobia bacterium ADurb.Bin474]